MRSCAKVCQAVSFCILTLAVVLAASSQAAAQAVAREFIYTANFADNTVSGFSLNPVTGSATEVPGSPFGSGSGPFSITHSPDGRFLYAVMKAQVLGRPCGDSGNGELISYSVDPGTGALTLVDNVTLSGVCSGGVAVDPTGQFVYAASFPLEGPKVGIIDGYQASNGHLTPLPGSPFASPLEVSFGQNPAISEIAIPPNGEVLYASNPNDSQGILIFDRDTTTGALTFRTGVDTGTSIGPMAITASGRFILALGDFLTGSSGAPGVFEFAIGPHGDLTPVAGSPFSMTSGFGGAMAVSPNGEFVDVSVSGGSGGIDAFRRDARGRLSLAPGSPFTGSAPFAFALAFDPDGRFLVEAGEILRSDRRTGALTHASDFTPGGFVQSLTVTRTCEEAAETDGKDDCGCHAREGENGND